REGWPGTWPTAVARAPGPARRVVRHRADIGLAFRTRGATGDCERGSRRYSQSRPVNCNGQSLARDLPACVDSRPGERSNANHVRAKNPRLDSDRQRIGAWDRWRRDGASGRTAIKAGTINAAGKSAG